MTYRLARERYEQMVAQQECYVADGTCGHKMLGKFDSCQDERAYELTREGADDNIGSVDELGHFAIVTDVHLSGSKYAATADHFIVETTSSGAVYVHWFDTRLEAIEAWNTIVDDYVNLWGEDNEDYV